jgi:hypothetical protein
MLDTKAIAEATARVVKEALRPLSDRIEAIERRLDALPAPKDGKDADPRETAAVVRQEIDEELKALREAIDAIPPPPEIPDIPAMVKEAVEALPKPKDGKDGAKGDPGEPGEPGPAGKDGVGLAGALIDRDGGLVVTLTDGSTRELGPVVGKDGAPGADGRDGLGFEEMSEELADDGRTIIRRYVRGDVVKEFRHTFSVVLDRGVFKTGETYRAGDGVTWAGSYWIAQEDTSEKPDGGKGWRLAVKRGRDGKDGGR